MSQINIPFDANNFTGGPITNRYMPLAVGNTWVYSDSDGSIDTVIVTNQAITIDGVQCVLVSDIVMAVTVEINTGERRIIDYLLSPLLRHTQESLRER